MASREFRVPSQLKQLMSVQWHKVQLAPIFMLTPQRRYGEIVHWALRRQETEDPRSEWSA